MPPELDHFNRASIPSNAASSDDEGGSENGKEKPRKAVSSSTTTTPTAATSTPTPTTPIAPGSVRKSASNLLTKKQQQQAKLLPPSVRALQKKYVERRLVRSVVTKSIRTVTSSTPMSKPSAGASSVAVRNKPQPEGMKTRSAQKLSARRSLRKMPDVPSKTQNMKVQSTTRKPSAASIVAKRKTRMATLTAASNRVSR